MFIIGENIHVISPKVKEAIENRDAETIQQMAVAQVEAGAGVVDLNIGPQKKQGHEVMPWMVEAVQAVVDVPLSLHGASGLPEDDVRRALSLGVSKVNVNTEIRQRYLGELEAQLPVCSACRIAESFRERFPDRVVDRDRSGRALA